MGWFFSAKTKMVVNPATPGDIARLADIHAKSFARAWNEADISRLIASKGAFALAARIEGNAQAGPVGFVIVRVAADEAEIITIATDPSARRQGTGLELMHAAIRELQAERIARLFLEVDENNAAALGLYKRLGFHKVGERKGYYANAGNATALVMELDLR